MSRVRGYRLHCHPVSPRANKPSLLGITIQRIQDFFSSLAIQYPFDRSDRLIVKLLRRRQAFVPVESMRQSRKDMNSCRNTDDRQYVSKLNPSTVNNSPIPVQLLIEQQRIVPQRIPPSNEKSRPRKSLDGIILGITDEQTRLVRVLSAEQVRILLQHRSWQHGCKPVLIVGAHILAGEEIERERSEVVQPWNTQDKTFDGPLLRLG